MCSVMCIRYTLQTNCQRAICPPTLPATLPSLTMPSLAARLSPCPRCSCSCSWSRAGAVSSLSCISSLCPRLLSTAPGQLCSALGAAARCRWQMVAAVATVPSSKHAQMVPATAEWSQHWPGAVLYCTVLYCAVLCCTERILLCRTLPL